MKGIRRKALELLWEAAAIADVLRTVSGSRKKK